ncbi:MAG: ABC transporter ATP-binding protein [Pseudomonadota bacterium]
MAIKYDDTPDRLPTAPLPEPLARPFEPFERLIDPFSRYSETRPPGELWPFLKWALRDLRVPVGLLALFAFLVGAAEAATFYLIGLLVDRASASGPADFFVAEWPIVLAVTVLVLLKPLAQLGQSATSSLTVGPGIVTQTVWRLHRHTLGQSMRFFEEDFTGRITQKETQTGMALTSVVIDALSALGMLAAYVVAIAAILGAADIWLGAGVLAWAASFVGILAWAVPRVRKRAMMRAAARANVTGQLVDSLSHMKTVKLFAHAAREEASAEKALRTYRDAGVSFGRTMLSLRVILNVLNVVVTLGLIGGALWAWHVGHTSVGVVAMAAMMTIRLTAMSNWMAQSALSIFGELGTIEDGAKTLSPAHEVVDRPGAVAPETVRGAVRFEDVTFRYGRQVGGIGGFNLDIAPGEKVGLVGRSGAGKSTAVSLLLRLYDVETGRITIDGHDVRDLTQDRLRQAIAMVTQETAIFNRSALDNVLYGRPDAGADAAFEAARRAEAHEFILGLCDSRGREGYEAKLGERGVKLSGGQRQRIALARAILKDAPVLVLDEATSALDSEVEASIQTALRRVMEGKTVLAIAHRLSTLSAMDRIVVMDEGRIAEQGTHNALVRSGGLYASLWERQSGGASPVTIAAQ